MDQTLVQAKANYGYGKMGAFLGQAVTAYRPDAQQALIPALDTRYRRAQLVAWFNPDANFRQLKPALSDKPVVYAGIDRTLLQAGDYLMDAGESTWFVGSVQALQATPCIRCNRAFTVTRAVPAIGADAYGGNAPANMTTILTSWPGFIAAKARGVSPEERLPGDTKLNVVTISIPVTPGVEVLPNDVLVDDQADASRYSVSLAVATDWGWTIDAYYAGA